MIPYEVSFSASADGPVPHESAIGVSAANPRDAARLALVSAPAHGEAHRLFFNGRVVAWVWPKNVARHPATGCPMVVQGVELRPMMRGGAS